METIPSDDSLNEQPPSQPSAPEEETLEQKMARVINMDKNKPEFTDEPKQTIGEDSIDMTGNPPPGGNDIEFEDIPDNPETEPGAEEEKTAEPKSKTKGISKVIVNTYSKIHELAYDKLYYAAAFRRQERTDLQLIQAKIRQAKINKESLHLTEYCVDLVDRGATLDQKFEDEVILSEEEKTELAECTSDCIATLTSLKPDSPWTRLWLTLGLINMPPLMTTAMMFAGKFLGRKTDVVERDLGQMKKAS